MQHASSRNLSIPKFSLPNNILDPKAWFSNVRGDLLAGAVVALALIPEAIAFSLMAGVDPKVGLYASFTMAITVGILGGRTGMISAATGAMAILVKDLVGTYGPTEGLQYILAATILAGLLQIFFGIIKVGNQVRFIPRAVMVGFINALAIIIFRAQLPQLQGDGANIVVYAMVAVALAIIYLLPRITTLVPSPLVAITVITAFSMITGVNVPTVGDEGSIPAALPSFGLPALPFDVGTLEIIFPVALALSVVGLVDSFLTANVVDELTDTSSDKNQETFAQGIANVITGCFGGMAGCAMIGQSVINIKSGGRQRLSTFSAGVLLLFFLLVMGPWVKQIPMAALVAVMFMVSIGTFNWDSIRNIKKLPRSETAIMVTTVVATLVTNNLAIGVGSGVLFSTLIFAGKIAKVVFVDSSLDETGTHRTYSVAGQIFFVSNNTFLGAFDLRENLEQVTIDLTHAHLWDQGAVKAVDQIVLKFRRRGTIVNVVGLNEASATLVSRLGVHDKAQDIGDLANN
ncbi:MAG: SulP family inorganic anion transporter [Cyanobacteria bacterium P01_C01_bin.89]